MTAMRASALLSALSLWLVFTLSATDARAEDEGSDRTVRTTTGTTEVGYGRKFGLGFMVGDPTGLTGKLWVAPTNAIDFGFGLWGYGVYNCGRGLPCDRFGYHAGTLNVDYLWQSNIVRGPAQLDWYIGAGGRVLIFGGRGFDIAARAPIGLALMFNNPAFLEVFFELVPALYLAPPAFTIEGGLGVRFYF